MLIMLAPFDPDPECPFCGGDGFTRTVDGFDDVIDVSRCECTNWSTYAELRRAKWPDHAAGDRRNRGQP